MKLEQRAYAQELRTKGRKLEGYAALFSSETRIGGEFTEVIAPGAFSSTLSSARDILALQDHDPTKVLARTRSGSLRLSEDSKGLAFDLDLPDTQSGRDVLALAERGDLGGMSFGFTVKDQHRNGDRRELRAVELYEISVVSAWPAYDGTIVNARMMQGQDPWQAYISRELKIRELCNGPV